METKQTRRIKNKANEMIANAPTKEARESIHTIVSALLMECKAYNGFNYTHWTNGGCDQWRRDGEPEDKTPYLGDMSQIFFY